MVQQKYLTEATYITTLAQTASSVLDLFYNKVTDIEFAQNNLKIARSVEHIFPNRMVLDMTKSYANVMMKKMKLTEYFAKWEISEELEELFWKAYDEF